jgi:addiction module RelB/DinJ family antitoxin
MATAQLNVRIDADLKAAGDAVLDRFGVSSVQIVRSAWQYMVDHQRLPDFIQTSAAERTGQTTTKTDVGAGIALRLAQEAGLRVELEEMSYEELRQSAYEEMLVEEAQHRA